MSDQRLIDAFNAGEARGNAMKPGVVFLGAMPEAEKAGYARGTHEYNLFLGAFLDALHVRYPHGIPVGAENKIMSD